VALTNPVPEIAIDEALAGGAAIAADGSIVNNVLAYPGLFRGALDAGASSITTAMKRAAAEALSSLAPGGDLLPDALDRTVHAEVARRVAEASQESRAKSQENLES
jgi:malate dehydrogenase (oxaloacetate-decarboxylating)